MLVGCCQETLKEPVDDSKSTPSLSTLSTEPATKASVNDFGTGTSSWYEGGLLVSIPTSSTYPLSTKSNLAGSYFNAAIL